MSPVSIKKPEARWFWLQQPISRNMTEQRQRWAGSPKREVVLRLLHTSRDLLCSLIRAILRVRWSVLVQTLAVVASAVFAGLLFWVTRDYTEFTRRMFHSQHEKYIYDVLGNRAFEVEILPAHANRSFDKPQLEVRVKNLAGLNFTRVRIEIFAELRERAGGNKKIVLIFAPSAQLIEKNLQEEGMLIVKDAQNDVAFHLKEHGLLTEDGRLKANLELTKFFAYVEGLSPGGVLWRLKGDAPR